MPKKKKLSERQQRFKELYMLHRNARKAGELAGFALSTAQSVCPLWVGKNRDSCPPKFRHVWDAIAEHREALTNKAEITIERILKEEACIAYLDPADHFKKDKLGYSMIPIPEMPENVRRAISGYEVFEKIVQVKDKDTKVIERKTKIKLNDKGRSLERCGKHRGMYIEKHEHSISKETIMLLINAIPEQFRNPVLEALRKLQDSKS